MVVSVRLFRIRIPSLFYLMSDSAHIIMWSQGE